MIKISNISKKFFTSGAKVFIWDIDEKELIKAVKEINNPNLEYNVVDVTNFNEIQNTVKKIDPPQMDEKQCF